MHEVAVPTTVATVFLILPASRFSKISDRREVGNNRSTRVESSLKCTQSCFSLLFLLEVDIDIAHHVISQIVTDIEAFNLPKLGELLEYVLIEIFKMFLDFFRVDWLALAVYAGGDHVRSLVHIGEQKSGGYGGTVVESGTSVSMATSTNLEVEWTIHTILFRTKYGSQVLSHCRQT